jgi:hypothetical protein
VWRDCGNVRARGDASASKSRNVRRGNRKTPAIVAELHYAKAIVAAESARMRANRKRSPRTAIS